VKMKEDGPSSAITIKAREGWGRDKNREEIR
jgi:hypothetical protein